MISALIVDDVQTELDVILYLIKKYELPLLADTASNGEEALAYLEHHTVDLLITDIKMPFMDGLELSKRAMARNPQIKIMISSGYSDFSYAKTAISIGVEEYLLKPIQPEEFVSTVKKVCEQIMKTRHTQKQVNELLSSLQTIYKLPSGMDAADVPAPQALERTIHALMEKNASEKQNTTGTANREAVNSVSSKILFLCDYISTHYQEDLSVEVLAGMIYVHPDYLSRTFKKETGISLNHYIKTTRMKRACCLLETTQQKIKTIGAEVGYQNCAYFIRSFTNHFGVSPEKYRQQYMERKGEKE